MVGKEGEPKRVITTGRVVLGGIAAAGFIASGSAAADHHVSTPEDLNIPGIARDISSIPGQMWNWGMSAKEDIERLLGTEQAVSSIFDNSKEKGTMSTNNTIIVHNLEDFQGIPQSSEDGHTVNILMPIQGMPTSGKIDYTRDLTGSRSDFNPVYAPEPRRYALEKGIKDSLVLKNIPAGHTILAPVDGELMYNRIRNDIPEGTLDSAMFFVKDENGILYQILISDASAKPLAPILDVPARGIKDYDTRKFKHPIKKGEPVLKVLQQGEIMIWAKALPRGSTSGADIYPVNINLNTTIDPTANQEKILIVEK